MITSFSSSQFAVSLVHEFVAWCVCQRTPRFSGRGVYSIASRVFSAGAQIYQNKRFDSYGSCVWAGLVHTLSQLHPPTSLPALDALEADLSSKRYSGEFYSMFRMISISILFLSAVSLPRSLLCFAWGSQKHYYRKRKGLLCILGLQNSHSYIRKSGN